MSPESQARLSASADASQFSDWHDPLSIAYRRFGYLSANTDPLGRAPAYVHPDILDLHADADPARIEALQRAWCGPLCVEFGHMRHREKARWLTAAMESEPGDFDLERVFEQVLRAEALEAFIHKRYIGTKRYSIDGGAGLLPLLHEILDEGLRAGVELAILGMSHRGRLNVMVNLVGKSATDLFTGLEDVDPRSTLGSGDVKYHLGATGPYEGPDGRTLALHLVSNPSHLEAVNPVLLGRARARQLRHGEGGKQAILPICIHGDAAFAGQGVTAETLNLADLPGFRAGGTVHVLLNNRIGFTAEPEALHSTEFSSDLGRRLEMPIFRVNGEDPAAIVRAARLITRYRQTFESDVLLDLVVYRRHGHSEVEDPTTTSPALYRLISERPKFYEMLADDLGLDEEETEKRVKALDEEFSEAQKEGKERDRRPVLRQLPSYWDDYFGGRHQESYEVPTNTTADALELTAKAMTATPDDFDVHDKVQRFLEQRAAMLRGEKPLDYGAAECAAFASTLIEGHPVRLSGQDSQRGTFNHRNAVIFDQHSSQPHIPLRHLLPDQGFFEVISSPLSEEAAVGYEYGFSRDCPDGLVMWEAQFGDFVNGAQIHIDQFLAAGEDKWGLLSGLVLLLPHGYEGQGPEHSSARVERFLQLSSEHNIQISQPTTAAQYFHLLRRQVLRKWRKPLIVFTPKGMLRAKAATSPVEELLEGKYHRVLGDSTVKDPERVLLCTGKIVHELLDERARRGDDRTAIISLEDLYPFPKDTLREELKKHASARKLVWVQEEPANKGARTFVRPEIEQLANGRHVTTVKRSASASPATGSAKAHKLEQQTLLELAFR